MKHIYLINNCCYGSSNEMPNESDYSFRHKDFLSYKLKPWYDNLTELDCDYVEMAKILTHKSIQVLPVFNPIDITSITTVKDGKVYFKDVESESLDYDFIVSALNHYWNDAYFNLQRKDLGDIERKNYEYQLKVSKQQMNILLNKQA